MFCDAIFYFYPSIAYQLFITRVYDETKNVYYTTSFTLIRGKAREDYEVVFRKLNDHLTQYLDIDEEYEIKELHSDFKIQIGEDCKTVYTNVEIK